MMQRNLFAKRRKNYTFRILLATFLLACACLTAALFYLNNPSVLAGLAQNKDGMKSVTESVYGDGKDAAKVKPEEDRVSQIHLVQRMEDNKEKPENQQNTPENLEE